MVRQETGKIIGIGRQVSGLRKDGTQFPLDLAVTEIVIDGKRTFIGILRDITERRKAEEALEHSQRQLMDLTANIPGAVFQMRRSEQGYCQILFISEGIEKLGGRVAREIIENPGLMLEEIHPDDASTVAQELDTALRAGTPYKCTYRVQKNGEMHWLSASALPQEENCKDDPLWNGVIVDVTSSKEAERKLESYAHELAEAVAKAQSATKAKSEFLATMSHEIRTPMNGVIGMTGLLLETQLSSEQMEYAETIRASGEALLAIINDILDFSKIEAGKLDLENCAFDLRPVVEESLEVVAPLAQRKKTELCAPMDASIPQGLIGDPARLRQILLNLLSNAIKFTEGGEVVLSVSREEGAEGPDSVRLKFEIRDTGIGISEAAQSKLFQSFSQADSSTTRRFGGTGLGLAICKKLVELMGGEIGVRSAPNAGSTFWFRIPFKTSAETVSVPVPIENLRNRRVLGVDDNGTNRSILKQQLGNIGMMVTCVASGVEAIEELNVAARQGRPYELAILDLHMPVMNGLMLAREIRQGPAICWIPLMMLTSDRDRDDVATARELDVKLFLLKPVRQANLIKAVGEMFGAVPVQAASSASARPAKLSGRVLVVDDNATNQKVIVLRLQKLGCTVDVASNGSEAVTAAGLMPFDVILMDCQMPVMDGFEATSEIRKRGGHRTPIIALTANAMDGERDRCLEAGMDDYLSKPVRLDELVKKLEHWIGAGASVAGVTRASTVPNSMRPGEATGIRAALDQFIASMEEEGIERDEVETIFSSFLETSSVLINDLHSAIREKDGEVLANVAHTLKGSFANLHMIALADFASELEKAGKERSWDGASEKLALATSAYQEARQLVSEAIRVPTK
jgi:two-component system sensor histidine kinase/response regulator